MRNRWIGTCLLMAAVGGFVSPSQLQAQPYYDVPGNPSVQIPLPLGHDRPESGGFYSALEFVYMHQTRALGDQAVAFRGFFDTTGLIQGFLNQNFVDSPFPFIGIDTVPGPANGFLGSRTLALATNQIGQTSWHPGYRLEVGYRFDNGVSISAQYMQLFEQRQAATASATPPVTSPLGNNPLDFAVTAPVFNFPNQFAGPPVKTIFDGNVPVVQGLFNLPTAVTAFLPIQRFPVGLVYGIWNGANTMTISYTQRFQQFDLTARLPVFDTEYSRVYALATGRFAWFFERFNWRTVSVPTQEATVTGTFTNGVGDVLQGLDPSSRDVAVYTNTLSQRLYGPVLGMGADTYLGDTAIGGFAANCDTTGGLLLNIIKQRAKYKLEDESIQNKRSTNKYSIVPNLNLNLNLWWYPVPNIQLRAGYNVQGYFNTRFMDQPIDFNYGGLDPVYDTKFLRVIHGFNAGIGFTF